MYFITSGHVAVGYSMVSEVFHAKYLQENQTFGDYSCFENKKSEFHYTAITEVEGFAIRKRRILDILERFSDKHSDFAGQLRVQVFTNYRNLIRNHVNEHKQDNIKQLRERGEYDEFGVPEFNVRQLNEEEFVEKLLVAKTKKPVNCQDCHNKKARFLPRAEKDGSGEGGK